MLVPHQFVNLRINIPLNHEQEDTDILELFHMEQQFFLMQSVHSPLILLKTSGSDVEVLGTDRQPCCFILS